MLAGPPLYTSGLPAARVASLKAEISGQYMPTINSPAMKAPKICEKMKWGTFFHGKPCQTAKQMVMAGLK